MTWRLILLIVTLASGPTGFAQEPRGELAGVKERELEEVRERISELKQSMDRSAAERDRLAAELQGIEIEIAKQRKRIKEIERERRYGERKKQQLDADVTEREAHLDEQSRELAAQVRAAYMSGSQEKIKLLLNQRDPATLGRVMAYYRYLNDYRAENILAVMEQIQRLEELRREIDAEEARLAELARRRYAELGRLNTSQESRQALLAALRKRISSEGQEVERLAAQEQDLTKLISELTSILSDYPISAEQPFSTYKGRLTWPVVGTLLHDFGQPRVSNKLKWKGVVLAAPRGQEVRAIYHGRVAFADWLTGMGLIVIIDHGEGYMTLYGYNETVLKNAGDWVAPGDVIATVGDSGGQQQTGLYFELRKGVRPIDPRPWITRRPGS